VSTKIKTRAPDPRVFLVEQLEAIAGLHAATATGAEAKQLKHDLIASASFADKETAAAVNFISKFPTVAQ
jgi:hypothetical protein